MPYRSIKRTRYSGRTGRASAAKTIQDAARKRLFTKNRGGLAKVARIQRAPYVPRPLKNTASIAAISRAVNKLQHQQLGLYQSRMERFNLDNTMESFTNQFPLCFCMNQLLDTASDMYAKVYRIDHSTRAGIVAGSFEKAYAGGYSGITEKYDPHFGASDDFPSKEVYQMLGTKIILSFEFNNAHAGDVAKWIRIDIVRPKKVFAVSDAHHLTLPVALEQFKNLATGDLDYQNTVNRSLWHCKTKWYKLTNFSGQNKDLKRTVVLKQSYKNTPLIKCDLNATAGSNFHGNVPPDMQEWMIISCGDSRPDRVRILRHTSWRDHVGVAMP